MSPSLGLHPTQLLLPHTRNLQKTDYSVYRGARTQLLLPVPTCPTCCPADELLFEVEAPDAVLDGAGRLQHPGQQFLQVAAAVKRLMEGAAPLTVPLRVKLAWGNSWGSLAELAL